MTTRDIEDVKKDIKAAILAGGADPVNTYFIVRECKSSGYRRQPTGMYAIDIWGIRNYNGPKRSHLFRTTKDGVVPTTKIVEAVKSYVLRQKLVADYTAAKQNAATANVKMVEDLREYAKDIGIYFADYASTHGTACITNEAAAGSVTISTGRLDLTEDQAYELLALLKKFRPKTK